jgi:hypothetical protein
LSDLTVLAENQMIRKYDFGYVTDGLHPYLREMKVSDANKNILNSTFFKYGELSANEVAHNNLADLTSKSSNYTSEVLSSGDFDGDGRTDILLGEYNGVKKDNYDSFVALTKNATGNNFTPGISTVLPKENKVVYAVGDGIKRQINFMAQDFNGDGFDDVPVVNTKIVFHVTPSAPQLAYLNTFSQTVSSIDIYPSQGSTAGICKFGISQVNSFSNPYNIIKKYSILTSTPLEL